MWRLRKNDNYVTFIQQPFVSGPKLPQALTVGLIRHQRCFDFPVLSTAVLTCLKRLSPHDIIAVRNNRRPTTQYQSDREKK